MARKGSNYDDIEQQILRSMQAKGLTTASSLLPPPRAPKPAYVAPARVKKYGRAVHPDMSASKCFEDLSWSKGVATATFAKDGTVYDYEMSRQDFMDWVEFDPGHGGVYFNAVIR